MADPPIDAASLEALSITDKHRPNFPLPRELRDEIYGYLLDRKHTRIPRERFSDGNGYDFRCQGYKFHTNILAVNHAIHDEAEEYLYKNNVFVVASVEWPDTPDLKGRDFFSGLLWTPIVTEKHAAKMQHHSLRLHFVRNLKTQSESRSVSGKGLKAPAHSCLLIEKDFDALCNTFRFHLSSLESFSVAIEEGGVSTNQRMKVCGVVSGVDDTKQQVPKPPDFWVQFRNTLFRASDAKVQDNVLNLLGNVFCGSMRMKIDGALPQFADRIRRLKDTMGPVFYSLHASDWVQVDILCEAKYLADHIVRAGELLLAETIYPKVDNLIRSYLAASRPPSAPNSTTFLIFLHLDVLLTLGYLQMKLSRTTGLADTTMIAKAWLRRLSTAPGSIHPPSALTHGVKACGMHFITLSDMYLARIHGRGTVSGTSVHDLIEILTPQEHLPYHSHDLTILRNVANKDDSVSDHLPFHACSVANISLPHFASHQSAEVSKKPDYMVGQQNLDALRRLGPQYKREINDAQRYYVQRITEWKA